VEFEIREVLLCYSWLSTALKLYFLCSVDTSFTPLGRESTFSPSPLLTLLWSGICHKRYWISWSVSGTFSCCCWLFDLSQPLFLEISSWFRSHFVQAHLQVCSWFFFCFFFGGMRYATLLLSSGCSTWCCFYARTLPFVCVTALLTSSRVQVWFLYELISYRGWKILSRSAVPAKHY